MLRSPSDTLALESPPTATTTPSAPCCSRSSMLVTATARSTSR